MAVAPCADLGSMDTPPKSTEKFVQDEAAGMNRQISLKKPVCSTVGGVPLEPGQVYQSGTARTTWLWAPSKQEESIVHERESMQGSCRGGRAGRSDWHPLCARGV